MLLRLLEKWTAIEAFFGIMQTVEPDLVFPLEYDHEFIYQLAGLLKPLQEIKVLAQRKSDSCGLR